MPTRPKVYERCTEDTQELIKGGNEKTLVLYTSF